MPPDTTAHNSPSRAVSVCCSATALCVTVLRCHAAGVLRCYAAGVLHCYAAGVLYKQSHWRNRTRRHWSQLALGLYQRAAVDCKASTCS